MSNPKLILTTINFLIRLLIGTNNLILSVNLKKKFSLKFFIFNFLFFNKNINFFKIV